MRMKGSGIHMVSKRCGQTALEIDESRLRWVYGGVDSPPTDESASIDALTLKQKVTESKVGQ